MKRLGIIIMLVVACYPGYGQRHLKGQQGLELNVGVLDNFNFFKDRNIKSYFIQSGYSWYNKKEDYWKWGFNYSEQRFKSFINPSNYYPVRQYTTDFMYYKKLITPRNRFFYFNVGFGPMIGFETVNDGDYDLSDGVVNYQIQDKNRFLYGAAICGDIELYLNDRIIFMIDAKERYLFNSDVQAMHFQLGSGLKFIIY